MSIKHFTPEQLPLTLIGRWTSSSSVHSSIHASWSGATIRFRCVAKGLSFVAGANAKRYHEHYDDAGVNIIVVYLRENENVHTFELDTKPGVEAVIFKGGETRDMEVEIRLVDWSATLEIDRFLVTEGEIFKTRVPAPVHKLLFIGDSITSAGVSNSGKHGLTRGSDDAYPFIVSRLLQKEIPPLDVGVDMVAYPGVFLVDREIEGQKTLGIASRFWDASPRSTTVPQKNPVNDATVAFIAIGLNDNCGPDGHHVAEDVFVRIMVDFIRGLRAHGPTLKHIAVLTPWQWEDGPIEKGYYEPHLHDAITSLSHDPEWIADGSAPLLHHMGTFGWYGDDQADLLDDCHPSSQGHAKIGRKLADWCIKTLSE